MQIEVNYRVYKYFRNYYKLTELEPIARYTTWSDKGVGNLYCFTDIYSPVVNNIRDPFGVKELLNVDYYFDVIGPTAMIIRFIDVMLGASDIIKLRRAQRFIRKFLDRKRAEKLAIMDQVFEKFYIPPELAEIILKEAKLLL